MTIRSLPFLALGLAALAPPAAAADVILLPPIEIRAPQPLVPASYRHTPLPPYPAAAREQRLEGVVVLSVLVGTSGGVLAVSVATSSGAPVLDEVAVGAVRKWTFVPASRGSRSVESVVEVPVKFALSRE
ncbi:MAG: TonB family protein [Candidatus Rokubacteria bacterium]|nr:TonB family protein [candidate division NC10 bacterium]MBI4254769.1 TonB family protein [Candidatus Rokubacteria bacterium]